MAGNNEQERIGYMTSAGWDKLLEQVNTHIEELEKNLRPRTQRTDF